MGIVRGLLLQAAIILTWVWFVYRGADGAQHLKIFFWNNLVGRFTAVDAPRFAVRGGASQFAGKIPDRTADVFIPVDIVGSGGGAARLAAASNLAA